MSPPQRTETIDQWSKKFNLDLQTKFKQLEHYQLLIVLFSDRKKYSVIKQEAELNIGCLTQCLQTKTINKDNIATNVSNLLLKINAKLNGTNHTLARKPACLNGNVMFLGADVTHPTPGNKDVPSYAAVTASHDCDFFKYNMVAQIQPPTKECITGFGNIVLGQLKIFYKESSQKPDHIIYLRDGVSEGQFVEILQQEVNALKAACSRLPDYKPKITCIVVMKRHHTRLFPVDANNNYDKYYNAPAGTCVDTGITHPVEMNLKDFYLASHAAIQGVTKPTKYCTIYDDARLTYDDVEELVFYLCHMYTRCNRAVSYPAPTYYAHLAAERAKVLCHMKEIDWDRLETEGKIEIAIKNVEKMRMHFV